MMKTKRLLKEIWKSGLIPLILGYLIVTQGNNLIDYLVGGVTLIVGLGLGYYYTNPSRDTSDKRSKEGDE